MNGGNLSGFDAKAVEPNQGFDIIPAGEYDACIVASAIQPTAQGDGKYPEAGTADPQRRVPEQASFRRLNISTPSAKAQEIARGTLSAICRAVGVLTPSDSSDLHNKPLRVKVVVKKSDEYGEQNKIKAYKPRNGHPSRRSKARRPRGRQSTLDARSAAYQETVRQAASVF